MKINPTCFHLTFLTLINQIMLDMSGQEIIDMSSIAGSLSNFGLDSDTLKNKTEKDHIVHI